MQTLRLLRRPPLDTYRPTPAELAQLQVWHDTATGRAAGGQCVHCGGESQSNLAQEPICVCCFLSVSAGLWPLFLRTLLEKPVFDFDSWLLKTRPAFNTISFSEIKSISIKHGEFWAQHFQELLNTDFPNFKPVDNSVKGSAPGVKIHMARRRADAIRGLLNRLSTRCWWCQEPLTDLNWSRDCVLTFPWGHHTQRRNGKVMSSATPDSLVREIFYELAYEAGFLVPACRRCNCARGYWGVSARAILLRVLHGHTSLEKL